jgi:hypothetical protein
MLLGMDFVLYLTQRVYHIVFTLREKACLWSQHLLYMLHGSHCVPFAVRYLVFHPIRVELEPNNTI